MNFSRNPVQTILFIIGTIILWRCHAWPIASAFTLMLFFCNYHIIRKPYAKWLDVVPKS